MTDSGFSKVPPGSGIAAPRGDGPQAFRIEAVSGPVAANARPARLPGTVLSLIPGKSIEIGTDKGRLTLRLQGETALSGLHEGDSVLLDVPAGTPPRQARVSPAPPVQDPAARSTAGGTAQAGSKSPSGPDSPGGAPAPVSGQAQIGTQIGTRADPHAKDNPAPLPQQPYPASSPSSAPSPQTVVAPVVAPVVARPVAPIVTPAAPVTAFLPETIPAPAISPASFTDAAGTNTRPTVPPPLSRDIFSLLQHPATEQLPQPLRAAPLPAGTLIRLLPLAAAGETPAGPQAAFSTPQTLPGTVAPPGTPETTQAQAQGQIAQDQIQAQARPESPAPHAGQGVPAVPAPPSASAAAPAAPITPPQATTGGNAGAPLPQTPPPPATISVTPADGGPAQPAPFLDGRHPVDARYLGPAGENNALAAPGADRGTTPHPAETSPPGKSGEPVPVQALVTGATAQGLPILMLRGNGGAPLFFIMQFAASNLPPGTVIDLAPETLTPGQAVGGGQAAGPSPWQGTAGTWPALDELNALLPQLMEGGLPGAAIQAIRANPAASAQFPAAALMLVAAMRAGDLSGWLGDKTLDGLKRLGKSDLAARLGGDVAAAGRAAGAHGNEAAQEWKSLPLPLTWDNKFQPVMMHYRHDRPQEDESGDEAPARQTRFIFDLTLSRMGGVQIDGYHHKGRLDLILRTQAPLSQKMQARMRQAYANALSQAGVAGEMMFQGNRNQFVTIMAKQPAAPAGVVTA